MNMRELFYQLLKEASNGAVFLDDEKWPIGFNTVIYKNDKLSKSYFGESNLSTLIIRDEEEFFKYLDIYLKKELELGRKCPIFIRDKLKFYMVYLFVNASIVDFENSVSYLKRKIHALDDHTFSLKEPVCVSLGNIFQPKILENIDLEIRNVVQDVRMETLYRMEFSLLCSHDGKRFSFDLPSVSYEIFDSCGEKYCYIYSILNQSSKKSDEEEKEKEEKEAEERYKKQVSRILYKINQGVSDDNLKDVSVSSVLSLTIFLSMLKMKNVRNIRAILYLPVRYLSRELAALDVSSLEKSESLLERNNRIQTNLTEKFLTTFQRVAYHLGGVQILDDNSIDGGYVDFKVDSFFREIDNPLLNAINHFVTIKR